MTAHRRAVDAAGTDWKSAVYRKVEEEAKADRGLTMARMVYSRRADERGVRGQAGVRPIQQSGNALQVRTRRPFGEEGSGAVRRGLGECDRGQERSAAGG